MKTAEEQSVDWLKRTLSSNFKERSTIFSNIRSGSIDVKACLEEILEPLGVPYTINSEDWSSIINISAEISISGSFNPKDLTVQFVIEVNWLGNTFTSDTFKEVVPLVNLKEYQPVLAKAVAQAKKLSDGIIGRMKGHSKSKLLTTLIKSRLKEMNASAISNDIKVSTCGSDCYKIGYPFSVMLSAAVKATLHNYVEQIDSLVGTIQTATAIKHIGWLKFINIRGYNRNLFQQGMSKNPVWTGEVRQIQYPTPGIAAEEFANIRKDLIPAAILGVLDECGYNYYAQDNDIYIVLTEDTKIVFSNSKIYYNTKYSYLCRNDKIIGDRYEMQDKDFIILLRVIAAVPEDSIALLGRSVSFKNLIDNLFGKVVPESLLPDYCLFRYQPKGFDVGNDIIIFRNNIPTESEDESIDSIALVIPHRGRYYTNYFNLLTNLESFHKLLTDPHVCAEGMTSNDVILPDDVLAAEIAVKFNGADDLSEIFASCNPYTIYLSAFDTRNAFSMRAMFKDCWQLVILDVSNFNTSKVVDMSEMFHGCSGVIEFDVSGFDTSKVTSMSGMFYNCCSLITLDVSNFDTSNVRDMSGMFYNCRNLTTLDVSNFDTSNVKDMSGMLEECYYLSELNLSGWNLQNLQKKKEMFRVCYNLKTIIMRGCTADTVSLIKAQVAADGVKGVKIITK